MKRFVFQILPFGAALAVAALFPGCAGYELGEVKPASYEGINNIHVPPFKNSTLEPRLSSLVTNAVLKELQMDGTYKVTNRENADAVLVGEIKEVRKNQLRAVRTDTLQSQELRLFLYVDFYLRDPVSGARIESTVPESRGSSKYGASEESDVITARQGRVVGDTIQFVDKSFQVGERAALAVASEDLANKLVSQLSNGW